MKSTASRFALPQAHAWQSPDHPVRLVEQAWRKDDPDPTAVAGSGVLWQEGSPQAPDRSQIWLRFVTGRPVSAITIQFLDWCCQRLLKQGKTRLSVDLGQCPPFIRAKLCVPGSAPTTERSSRRAKACASCPACCRRESPWLNPIEPKWVHAKRNVVELDGLLSARHLAERICAYFGCSYEPHLVISEQVA